MRETRNHSNGANLKSDMSREFLKKTIMKKIFLPVLILSSTVFISSCTKQGCTDSMANNYSSSAKKDDGSCKFDRDAFIGNYSATYTDLCEGISTGNMSITASTSAKNKIVITSDGNIVGTVNGTGVTIDSQTVDGLQFSGSGSINGNILTLNLTYYDSFLDETCSISINANKQ